MLGILVCTEINKVGEIMRKRVMWIDIARGIAMLSVIVGHSLFYYVSSDVGRYIYAFHMPIFFILSGYLYREKAYAKELKGAAKNLLLPYYATCLVMIAVFFVAQLKTPWLVNYPASFSDLVSAIFYGIGADSRLPFPAHVDSIGAIWLLLAMAIALQLFNLIIVFTKRLKSKRLVRVFIICLLAILGKLIATNWLLPLSLNAALFSLVFLYIGYLLQEQQLLEDISWKIFIVALFSWGLAASNQMFLLVSVGASDTLLAILGAVGGSIVVIKLSQLIATKKVVDSTLGTFGRLSIIVLCFHDVDLTYSQVPQMIMAADFTQNLIVKIIIVNLYRLIIPVLAVLLVPRIPGVRSLYLNRQYPFLKRKPDLVVKKKTN
ncbi:acyltransferase family protein [Lactiplantibacillus plantarum]|uniref:acyltransferase family protein n=2 Tax=Lactiplantibacillus plantarum TaxID=1590 RepID=UPI0007BB3BD6|nr:acyltransferase family protein [Lactiplantibacillus plantarum]KZT82998.1 O-acetyltransferase [Lactiplantibacillus plantarum]KZT89291.1 O-acetyltransferase [Lactiplantibacillus plantarum]